MDVYEKKKPDLSEINSSQEDLPLPSKSEIIRHEKHATEGRQFRPEIPSGKHDLIIEKPSKSFSIKEIISEEARPVENKVDPDEATDSETGLKPKAEFTRGEPRSCLAEVYRSA